MLIWKLRSPQVGGLQLARWEGGEACRGPPAMSRSAWESERLLRFLPEPRLARNESTQ